MMTPGAYGPKKRQFDILATMTLRQHTLHLQLSEESIS
jgi:hypothetical protein